MINETKTNYIFTRCLLVICFMASFLGHSKDTSHTAVSTKAATSTAVANESGNPTPPFIKKTVTESSISSTGPVTPSSLSSVLLMWDKSSVDLVFQFGINGGTSAAEYLCDGGTNSTPSLAGIANATTLSGLGNNVTYNP